ncbi:hypothetical protein [Actinomycetospora soli]|uniref:hypothetical protein n=1 Tax=Actinomycetospora soli TaxID=2893887 RepID=UPI001E63338F|nr:hypothetical protein [Actinomycetospora soli]MCD2191328.1 hypothetical protein [Actinomycetospora soli]
MSSPSPDPSGPGAGPDEGQSRPAAPDVDAVAQRRAALTVAGAARDVEEARMFLAMLGLDDQPLPDA